MQQRQTFLTFSLTTLNNLILLMPSTNMCKVKQLTEKFQLQLTNFGGSSIGKETDCVTFIHSLQQLNHKRVVPLCFLGGMTKERPK